MCARSILRAAALALLLLAAAPISLARALDAPELLYREGVSENEPLGPWLPLDGAHVNGLGFILGTRAQVKPPGDSSTLYRLTALAVPDGHPDQGAAFDPAAVCLGNARTPGTEVPLTTFRFEGPGQYTVRLGADLPSNGATPTSCSGGPSSTASFTIDPVITLKLLATAPVRVPAGSSTPVAQVADVPAGGAGQTQCARDATVQPDGSVAGADRTPLLGPTVAARDIPRAGRWTCVARAREAVTTGADGDHFTRWSTPVGFAAFSDFVTTRTVPDRRPRRFTVAYSDMPAGSQGGVVTLRISPGRRCPRVPVRTLRATVGRRLGVRFTFTLPEKDSAARFITGRHIDGYGWNFRLSFGGTPLVRKARSTEGAFVLPKRHPYGHILAFPGIPSAYCTHTA